MKVVFLFCYLCVHLHHFLFNKFPLFCAWYKAVMDLLMCWLLFIGHGSWLTNVCVVVLPLTLASKSPVEKGEKIIGIGRQASWKPFKLREHIIILLKCDYQIISCALHIAQPRWWLASLSKLPWFDNWFFAFKYEIVLIWQKVFAITLSTVRSCFLDFPSSYKKSMSFYSFYLSSHESLDKSFGVHLICLKPPLKYWLWLLMFIAFLFQNALNAVMQRFFCHFQLVSF